MKVVWVVVEVAVAAEVVAVAVAVLAFVPAGYHQHTQDSIFHS
jgi:hypothetical protein